jgi:hypothetical protein
MHSRDMLRKAKGDHPLSEGSRDDQVGEAGPIYQRPIVSKLTQRRLSVLSPLRSDGSRDRQAGGWSV